MTDGLDDPDERVVVFNSGAAQMSVEVIETELPTRATPVDRSQYL